MLSVQNPRVFSCCELLRDPPLMLGNWVGKGFFLSISIQYHVGSRSAPANGLDYIWQSANISNSELFQTFQLVLLFTGGHKPLNGGKANFGQTLIRITLIRNSLLLKLQSSSQQKDLVHSSSGF